MSATTSGTPAGPVLPDYVPVPPSSLGPPLNDQGYYVGRVERNLFWVTDGTYQCAFLATSEGIVLFDAPPTIGHNLQRAVDEIAEAEGVGNTVTHLVYSHHHADHAGAADLFGHDLVRIGHQETRRLLLRDNDPTRPAPEVTFQDAYTLRVGDERVELAFRGPNHSPDNIFIHFPDHDALMLIDIVNSGWVPIYNCNLSEDIPGYIDAPATALTYPWKTYIGGHLGRLGTRQDIELHQTYIADIVESARGALSTVDPTPYWAKYGQNVWAAVKGYLDAVTDAATAPVVEKYTGVLAAADIEEFTRSSTFMILQSMRLDLGAGSQVHPLTPVEAADRLAIRELFDAYAHCADRRDAEGQKALFTVDTRFAVYMDGDGTEPTYVLDGREALAPIFADLNRYEATTHFNGQSTVVLDGDQATGESYTLAHHLFTADGERKIMVASLRYRDRFVRIEGAWLFAERNLIVDWTETRTSAP